MRFVGTFGGLSSKSAAIIRVRKATAGEANCATIRRWRHCVFTLFQTRRSTRLRANMAPRSRSNCARRLTEGKANAALCCFLADQLNISQRAIFLEQGKRSRDKVIRIDGMSEEDVRSRLRIPN